MVIQAEDVLDNVMHYDLGRRKKYHFKYGDLEGFYISLHFTYDGFLVYAEVTWFKPSTLGFHVNYDYSTIACDYYSKSPFNDKCFDTVLDIAEKLVNEYPARIEID
jgi:hypothetical protein